MVFLSQPQEQKMVQNKLYSKAITPPKDIFDLEARNERRWQEHLSASLEIGDILTLFFNGIQSIVPCASIYYKNSPKHVALELGAVKAHSAKYTLNAQGYSIGEITFSRSKRFSQDDLQQIEQSLAYLFYPLRNALLYKEALDNSLKDGLTQIANRAAFELAIKRELGMAKRHNQPLSMIIIDLDFFKNINDSFGHHAGDCWLTHIAMLLKRTLRETDQVFRFGGEEFVILLANANLNAGFKVAERARKAIAKSEITVNDKKIQATASMGVSTCSLEDTRDSLFNRADKALYLAKNAGRNTIRTEWDLAKRLNCTM